MSPDGGWLAYTSGESGTHEAYVRSFPEPGPVKRISTDGGESPTWSPDGSAIYYIGERGMMRRDVELGGSVELGEEVLLFSVAGTRLRNGMRMLDLHPDDDRFIFVTVPSDIDESGAPAFEGIGPFVVVVNWFEEVTERMGGS